MSRITIFEGPDGGGKSTLAKGFAIRHKARYTHLGPFLGVKKHLAGLYLDAMLPALLGYQDVVLDRCWLSERPYGLAFRQGEDRLGDAQRRMLERVAMRCGASVVLCLPHIETCVANYLARKGEEYLDDPKQLRVVHGHYAAGQDSHLPTVPWDYAAHSQSQMMVELDQLLEAGAGAVPLVAHPPEALGTAGNWEAEVVVIGEEFGPHKEGDRLQQWPFISFSRLGCSHWLAEQLDSFGVGEQSLLWVNADQLTTTTLTHLRGRRVITLGDEAAKKVDAFVTANRVSHAPHPQYWKRFHAGERYPLINTLREALL